MECQIMHFVYSFFFISVKNSVKDSQQLVWHKLQFISYYLKFQFFLSCWLVFLSIGADGLFGETGFSVN